MVFYRILSFFIVYGVVSPYHSRTGKKVAIASRISGLLDIACRSKSCYDNSVEFHEKPFGRSHAVRDNNIGVLCWNFQK